MLRRKDLEVVGDEMGKSVCVKTTKCVIDVYKTAEQNSARLRNQFMEEYC